MTALFLPYTHQLFFSPQHYQHILIHYQLAFVVSSIQRPILDRIGHLIFTLSNFKYQSWPGLVTCFSVSPIANTNPGQDWSPDFESLKFQIPILARIGHMTSSLTTNSNTNQYTHRLFFSLTGCLLHHKKSFISPSSTYLLFLVPQVAFTIKKKTFYFPSFPHPPSPTFFCLQHCQKHYQQHIYSLSTCLFSLLNSNTNPGQDWSHD